MYGSADQNMAAYNRPLVKSFNKHNFTAIGQFENHYPSTTIAQSMK